MKQGKSIAKNTLALSLPNFINPLVSFALVLLISRRLGAQGLGEYSLVLTYGGLFMTVASCGLQSLLVREVAKDRDAAHLWLVNALLFGAVASLLAMLLMNLILYFMGYAPEVNLAIFIFSLSLIATTGSRYLEAMFRAFERSTVYAFVYMGENLLRVACCIPLVLLGFGVVSLIAATTGAMIISFIAFSYCYIRSFGRPVLKLRPDIWRLLFRQAPVFASIAIFSTIHLTIATLMLSFFKGVAAVGVYSAADRLLDICKTAPIAFAATLLPFFAREFLQGPARLQALTERAVKYAFLGLLPVIVGAIVLGDQIIALVYGDKFARAGIVLQFHIVSLLPFSLVYIFANALIATNKQKVDLSINIVAACLNILLNLLLIPYFSELGAVIATLISVLAFNQLQYMWIKKNLFSIDHVRLSWRIFVCCACMAAVTYLLRGIPLFANIALSALVYCGCVFAFGVLDGEEKAFLKEIILRKRGTREEAPRV